MPYTNAQQQQGFNIQQQQIPMPMPVRQLGGYGNTRVPNYQAPNVLPAVFNDDEPFKESVK